MQLVHQRVGVAASRIAVLCLVQRLLQLGDLLRALRLRGQTGLKLCMTPTPTPNKRIGEQHEPEPEDPPPPRRARRRRHSAEPAGPTFHAAPMNTAAGDD